MYTETNIQTLSKEFMSYPYDSGNHKINKQTNRQIKTVNAMGQLSKTFVYKNGASSNDFIQGCESDLHGFPAVYW